MKEFARHSVTLVVGAKEIGDCSVVVDGPASCCPQGERSLSQTFASGVKG